MDSHNQERAVTAKEAKLQAWTDLLDAREKALDAREHQLNEKERGIERKMADIAVLEKPAGSTHHLDPIKTVVTTREMTAQHERGRAHGALKNVETHLRPAAEPDDVDKLNDLPGDAFLTPQAQRHH